MASLVRRPAFGRKSDRRLFAFALATMAQTQIAEKKVLTPDV
jgi:hypothetical protein